MCKGARSVEFTLPSWLSDYARNYRATLDHEQRMAFVINVARNNVVTGSGGPFAAGVFEIATGKLISLGVNLVVTGGLSILHAEIVAISLAQRILGTYDLGGQNAPHLELITSTEPCAMCFGAILWSGVRRVIIGARGADAEEIGFDEGPKVDAWKAELKLRGIETVCDVKRDSALEVFHEYVKFGGAIYNAREA